ncbi:MAG: copper amine oxidase N-terminal domain-containing protein [Clostridia bacterium]|nr:copper amine oxidase N-terminal domain-containing protein [Clostridia bacterium]
MKKVFALIVSVVMIFGVFAVSVSADDISVFVNGSQVFFDQPPIISDGRTLVPLRAIFEALGAEVNWDGATSTVTSSRGGTYMSIQIGNSVMNVNGVEKYLDVPAQIISNRTLVPVRAISEAYGCSVSWDGGTRSVYVNDNTTAGNTSGAFYPDTTIPTYDSVTGAQFIEKVEEFKGYYIYKFNGVDDVNKYINYAAQYGWIDQSDSYRENEYGFEHFLWSDDAFHGFSIFVFYADNTVDIVGAAPME